MKLSRPIHRVRGLRICMVPFSALFAVSASGASSSWTNATDAVWSTGGDWVAGVVPVVTDLAVFDATTVGNLNTTLSAEGLIREMAITTPAGLITIGGVDALTLSGGAMDMGEGAKGLAMNGVPALAVPMNGVVSGAEVNLNRIGAGEVTLSSANTAAPEEEPMKMPATMKVTREGDFTFANFRPLSIGAAPVVRPKLEAVRFDGERGAVGAARNGGKRVVKISTRNAGANGKVEDSGEVPADFAAALMLPHGTGPSVIAEAPVNLAETNERVSVNGGVFDNITANNTNTQLNIRIPRSARNLVSPPDLDYPTYIASTNPVGWWGMNETSGTTTADLSGAFGAANNLTAGGTFNGTAVYPGGVPDPLGARNINLKYGPTAMINQPGFVRGTSNTATYFAGAANVDPNPTASVAFGHAPGPVTTGNMDAPNNAELGAIYVYDGQTGYTGLSLEIWAKTDGVLNQDSERFIGSRHWGFGFTANGGFGGLHFTTFGKTDYFGLGMPSDNAWHQFGVTWTAATGTANFYLDGVPWGSSGGQTSMLAINPASINNAITVGGRVSGGQAFKGWIDEAVVWSFPRTDADFAASYQAAQTPLTLPTAYWVGTTGEVWNANTNNFARNIEGTTLSALPVNVETDVIFNANVASNFGNTTLGADTTIKSLTFNGNATASVGIGGGHTLTISPLSESVGVTVDAGSGNHTISTMVALGAAQTWTVSDASQTLNASGVISGAFAMTKAGLGTLVLSAENTYSGGTIVARGTLALDYTADGSKLTDASVLTFAGGTVDLRNGASLHNEAVASTTILDGLSAVTRTSGISVMRLNVITPSLGVIHFGGDSIADTDTTNTSGILGAWAAVAGSDWATNSTDAADGPITAYSAYTNINARSSSIADGAATNVRLLGDGTAGNIALAAATTTVNTLLQSNANFAGTVDTSGRTLAVNGIMLGSGGKALTIGTTADAGTVTAATAGGAIFLNNFSTTEALTVNAVIADNASASSLATVGTVVLKGTNTYTGPTMVNRGVLSVRNGAGPGGAAAGTTVHLGAVVELQHGTGFTVGAEALALNGTGINNGGALRNISGDNIWGGTITLASAARINSDAGKLTLGAASSITATNQNVTLGGSGNGAVSGTITIGNGALTKDGTGIWRLSGANTYTGATQVNDGTLVFMNTGARQGGSAVTAGASGTVGLGVGGAGFYNATDVDNLFDTTLSGFALNAASVVAIDTTAGDFDQTTNLSAARALTKLGPNTLTLSGTNTHAGMTTLSEGTLLITGSISGSATVNAGTLTVNGTISGDTTVNAGTLAVNGTISGSTFVNSGGTLAGNNSTGAMGNVTVNSGGTFAPGGSATGTLNTGTLTFAAGSIFGFEIDTFTPAIDIVGITGDLNITSGAIFNASDLANVVLPEGTPVPAIIDYSGTWNGGTFNGLADDSIFMIGVNVYQISYNGLDGVSSEVTLSVVPEPGTAVSLLGGLGLLLGARRRRA